MVNLFIYPELKDIDPSLIDDDVIARIEEGRAALARTQQRVSIIPELYWEFEKETIGYISETHREIGTLRAVKERFPNNNTIQQWCDYFIRCALCEIEELTDEVIHDREKARELERV
jgi:hypothetical protein